MDTTPTSSPQNRPESRRSLPGLIGVRTGVVLLEGVRGIGQGLAWVFGHAGRTMLSWTWSFLFHTVFRHAYGLYYPAKRKLQEVFRPAKQRVRYILANRAMVHTVLIVVTLAVSATSLQAEEVRNEDVGRDSLLYALVQDETLGQADIIVETAATDPVRPGSYLTTTGSVAANLPKLGEIVNLQETTALVGGGSVVKPSLASTTAAQRLRKSVEYHIVQPGDTVGTVAEQYGVSTNTILWENQLSAGDYIRPGDKLTILPTSGVSHRMASGETLDSVAKKFDADVNEILEYNKLADASTIRTEQVLIIPGGRVPPPPAPVVSSTSLASTSSGFIPPSAPVDSSQQLQWPTPGRRINQYFNFRHTGLDIDTNLSPIYAAESGVVSNTNWGRGYGQNIILSHGGGLQTLYAHLSQILVSNGQSVERGQTIGISGCTGWCTGDHLHFEVIYGGKRNPLDYLP